MITGLRFELSAGAAVTTTAEPPPAAAAAADRSVISMADGILAEAEPLIVCTFGMGRLGLGFDKKSEPPLAVQEVDPQALASDFPMLVPGCVLRTVQGQPVRSLLSTLVSSATRSRTKSVADMWSAPQVTGMPYDDVLALIKQSRPNGPTELGFIRPAAAVDQLNESLQEDEL